MPSEGTFLVLVMEKRMVAALAVVREHFFDVTASVVLPGSEDDTRSDFPENFRNPQ